jgi:hypothetical protein
MKAALPRRAWAVLEADGQLATHDGRLPLFWYRAIAERFRRAHVVEPNSIVRVEVVRTRRKRERP